MRAGNPEPFAAEEEAGRQRDAMLLSDPGPRMNRRMNVRSFPKQPETFP